jgi:integrase/recombinase XerD
MLGTGLRLSSALALRVDDIDLDQGTLYVRKTKNDAPLVLPIARQVCRQLARYLRRLAERELLFPGEAGGPLGRRQGAQRINRWAKAAGLAGVSAHRLRHTFATRLYRRTSDVLLVQQALGHRTVSSTMAYAQLDPARLRLHLSGQPAAQAAPRRRRKGSRRPAAKRPREPMSA